MKAGEKIGIVIFSSGGILHGLRCNIGIGRGGTVMSMILSLLVFCVAYQRVCSKAAIRPGWASAVAGAASRSARAPAAARRIVHDGGLVEHEQRPVIPDIGRVFDQRHAPVV